MATDGSLASADTRGGPAAGLRSAARGAASSIESSTSASGSVSDSVAPASRRKKRTSDEPAGPPGPPALASSGRPEGSRLLEEDAKSKISPAPGSTARAGDGAVPDDGAAAGGGGGGGSAGSASTATAGPSGAKSAPGASKLRIPLGGTSRGVVSTVDALPSAFDSVRLVSAAEAMNAAYRSTMEDAFVVVDKFGGDEGTGLFAVYDGHGGRFVAEYLRTHLHDNIERELLAKSDRSVEECLKSAFVVTDIECSRTGEAASGSTAILCLVRRQGPKRYVYTANCGDARAVLCHEGRAVRLSMDHKATDEPEVRRIESAGGFVLRKRVMGVLAVARAFGDFAFKKYVTPEPFTSTTKLNGSSSFLIIACDGVWDVMEDQEAVDMVRQHVQPGPKAAAGAPLKAAAMRSAADLIVKQSLRRGSSDNVTCLVVFL